MRITWVTRSFLDYRIPVYKEIDRLCNGQLTLIFNEEVVPSHLVEKMKDILGDRCIPMKGEIRLIGKKKQPISNSQSRSIRIPIQRGLVSTIKKSRPDIIISDGFFQWTYAPILLKLFNRKIKHIMCYEGWQHTERNAQGFRLKYRKVAMQYMDAICCNGSLCYEYIKELGYPPKKTYIGNMAADTTLFGSTCSYINDTECKTKKEVLNLKGIIYIFSGRLVQLKGIKELLHAWKEFTINKKATLLLVGDGAQKAELKEYCANNGLHNVIFTGVIEYKKLPIYYKSADLFIIPTLQDNWSLVVPEAMACGLPILCSKYNGCWPELVKPENGWVFDPLNQTSLVEALNKSYQAKDRLTEMGEESKKIVSQYTPEIAAKGIWEACKRSLK